MSDVPRQRAERLLREADIDALALAKPESFAWATGAPRAAAPVSAVLELLCVSAAWWVHIKQHHSHIVS